MAVLNLPLMVAFLLRNVEFSVTSQCEVLNKNKDDPKAYLGCWSGVTD